jgi:hypothetical protein
MANDPSLEIRRREKAKKYLRLFLMDNEEMNRLLRRKEIDDDRLQFALELTISDWNSTTPVTTRYSFSNFPSLYLLIHGGAIQCLKMAGLYQTRNHLTYIAGGSSFVRLDKGREYMAWAQNFASEYESKKLNLKIQGNVAHAMDGSGFSSEYELIGFDW